MDVAITAIGLDTGVAADLRISAPPGTAAGDILDAVRAAVGAPPGTPMSVSSRPVPDDGDAADCGLADGDVVRVGTRGALVSADPPLAEVVVATGPDSGRHVPLPAGGLVVGRDAQCGLAVDDPSVSRRHAGLTVAAESEDLRVVARDLGSANGTWLDGERLEPTTAVDLPLGAELRLGDTVLRVEPPWPAVATRGRDAVGRPPRPRPAPAAREVHFPAPPTPPAPSHVPLLAAFAPVAVGSALALSMHQWQFLAFTAMSPAVALGQAASDRRSCRRAARAAGQRHAVAYAEAAARCARELGTERAARRRDAPDLATLARSAVAAGGPLWQRGCDEPAGLSVRVGVGELPSTLRITGAPPATLAEVPLSVSLAGQVTGVCGPRSAALGLVRSLVVQAATLHGPDGLRLVVLAPGKVSDWRWARWLPHVRPGASAGPWALGFDDRQVGVRLGQLADEVDTRRHTLVVVDADAGGAIARRLDLLRSAATPSGRQPALSVLWCAGTEAALPHHCAAVVRLSTGERIRVRLVRDGAAGAVEGVPDLVSAVVAEATARAMAPLRPAGTSGTALPSTVRWADVAESDLRDHASARRWLARSWARGPSTEVLLGVDEAGPLRVDLCGDGPHALVAGTTGAGKSQLLLGIIASLAVGNRPDRLTMLLVDHKGGATFGACARLPHVAGLVTDLDATSTRRALQSLAAELRRREALFASVGAVDLDGYTAMASSNTDPREPIARLVVVVDEFAVVAEEQAEFVRGLVGIAQRGRSLGVHLILATQRPEGVVSADIRANTRLRVCLGVARETESRDVIDSPVAAAISRATPGRGYLRAGPGELRSFQAAQVAVRRTPRDAAGVTLSPVETLGEPAGADDVRATAVAPSDGSAETDLDVLMDAAADLASTEQIRTPHPPWLAPLPERLELSTLTSPNPDAVAWGVADLPARGRQEPVIAGLADGAVVVVAGMARSGRTTALRSRTLALAARLGPERLQLWAIDAANGLRDLATLPHCGAVIPALDEARVHRLLDHLRETVDHRRHRPRNAQPTLLLLIDGWEAVTAPGPARDGVTTADRLLRLAADGPSGGLQLVVACERGGLVGRLAGVATQRIALRLADPTDYALLGVPVRDLPSGLPAGRGVRSGDAAMVQLAVPDAAADDAARRWRPTAHRAPAFAPLPRRVALADLDAKPLEIRLGIAADERTVTTSRAALAGGFVVAGPPGAGRTSALRLLARQLAGRPVVVAAAFGSALLATADAVALPADDQDHAAAVLHSLLDRPDGPPDVLIDDADLLSDGPLRILLERLVRDPAGPVVAVSATTDSLAGAFRGPLVTALRARRGLLLTPSGPHDGGAFGVRLPVRRDGSEPPGRGWLVGGGAPLELQVADPADPNGAGAAQPRTDCELSAWGGRRRE